MSKKGMIKIISPRSIRLASTLSFLRKAKCLHSKVNKNVTKYMWEMRKFSLLRLNIQNAE